MFAWFMGCHISSALCFAQFQYSVLAHTGFTVTGDEWTDSLYVTARHTSVHWVNWRPAVKTGQLEVLFVFVTFVKCIRQKRIR